jgi:hypothetical protein
MALSPRGFEALLLLTGASGFSIFSSTFSYCWHVFLRERNRRDDFVLLAFRHTDYYGSVVSGSATTAILNEYPLF